MQLSTYLSFDGDCRAAFEFYADLLGGEIIAMMTFGDTPGCDEFPAEVGNRIMHGCVEIAGHRLMGTDATPAHPYQGVKGSHVTVHLHDPVEAERIFQALSDRGTVVMPLQETFWAARYGITVDRFGVPWMVNCEKAAVSSAA